MKLSILIVDDSKTDRYVLRRRLSKCPFEMVIGEAWDGQEAIEFFEDYQKKQASAPDQYPPIMIFLDINMPRVNGFGFLEAFDKIRADHAIESTVVVMFTSSPREDDRKQAYQWSFVSDFLVKGSFSNEDVLKVVQTQVDALSASL